jgi:hypothetical protein
MDKDKLSAALSLLTDEDLHELRRFFSLNKTGPLRHIVDDPALSSAVSPVVDRIVGEILALNDKEQALLWLRLADKWQPLDKLFSLYTRALVKAMRNTTKLEDVKKYVAICDYKKQHPDASDKEIGAKFKRHFKKQPTRSRINDILHREKEWRRTLRVLTVTSQLESTS